MLIEVDHETGQSCLDAVKRKVDMLGMVDKIKIHGMTMGERTIHIDVVSDLIDVIGGANVTKVTNGGWDTYLELTRA